jgi:chromosome partitioning protein
MKVKENLELLSGDKRLAALEKKLVGEIDGYTRLRELLKREELTRYDFILIDSPPSLGMLTANALSASSYLVIPLSASVFSLQGTNDLFETMKKVKSTFNPDIKLLGVIVNAFDEVPVISREIREKSRVPLGDYAFSCLLSKSIKIEEAAAPGSG